MKYSVESNQNNQQVEVTLHADQATAQVDDREYQFTLLQPAAHSYLVLYNNRVYNFTVEPPSNNHQEVAVHSRQQSFLFQVTNERQRRQKKGAAATGIITVLAPMPGRIVQVLKNVGDNVEAGQPVIVIEAMKMQNELTSPKTGKVTELKVTVGQTVSANDVLAIIE
jgi:biotin carboxyl carrier protein